MKKKDDRKIALEHTHTHTHTRNSKSILLTHRNKVRRNGSIKDEVRTDSNGLGPIEGNG